MANIYSQYRSGEVLSNLPLPDLLPLPYLYPHNIRDAIVPLAPDGWEKLELVLYYIKIGEAVDGHVWDNSW